MKAFEGKVVWVTGAGTGIGAATALRFAAEGAALVLSGLRADKLDDVAGRIGHAGGRAYCSPGDLGKPETSRAAGAVIEQQFGRLDILINCVGINIPNRSWADLQPDGVDTVLSANLAAPFYCVAVALPFMRARKSGLLVHIASTDGLRVGTTGGPAYAASKHGVVAMSHSINLEEAANGIRSCVICPGGVNTEFLNQRPNPPPPERRARLLRPDDVADAICYIASVPPTVRIDQLTITPAT